MAQQVLMPKQGNSVETCIILEWRKSEGDSIAIGEILCEAETDKATIEVESTAEGTILKLLFAVDEEVPVQIPIAIVGEAGEDISDLVSTDAEAETAQTEQSAPAEAQKSAPVTAVAAPVAPATTAAAPAVPAKQLGGATGISPRARKAALEKAVQTAGIQGTGPKGRIIERDVLAAAAHQPLTPAAKAQLEKGSYGIPAEGSGIGGRVRAGDLISGGSSYQSGQAQTINLDNVENGYKEIPVRSIRKITATRMYESISTTCQLTLHATADATRLKDLRSRLKASNPDLGMNKISINDLILYAVAKTLPQFPYVNSHFLGEEQVIREFDHVHLALAVDTERGLMVPVIRNADLRSLRDISSETVRLAESCRDGKITPEEMDGGTFTVSNLGVLGVDRFTPVLNIPQTAILGVGGIDLKPVEGSDGVEFRPHIALSLTFDHQAFDGAPAARFLNALCDAIKNIDLLLM